MFVAPDAAQDDVVLLSSLEGINTGYFDIFVQILLERAVELHIVDYVGSLALVRCHDTDLIWNNPRLEELGNNLLDVGCFGSKRKKINDVKGG